MADDDEGYMVAAILGLAGLFLGVVIAIDLLAKPNGRSDGGETGGGQPTPTPGDGGPTTYLAHITLAYPTTRPGPEALVQVFQGAVKFAGGLTVGGRLDLSWLGEGFWQGRETTFRADSQDGIWHGRATWFPPVTPDPPLPVDISIPMGTPSEGGPGPPGPPPDAEPTSWRLPGT